MWSSVPLETLRTRRMVGIISVDSKNLIVISPILYIHVGRARSKENWYQYAKRVRVYFIHIYQFTIYAVYSLIPHLHFIRFDTETTIEYRSYPTTTTDIGLFLKEYFQLHINLFDCYKRWSKADKNFAKIAGGFKGIRILKQDPVENLFCFICSQNNNIKRIEQMVRKWV